MYQVLKRLIDKRPCPACGNILIIPGSICACSYGESTPPQTKEETIAKTTYHTNGTIATTISSYQREGQEAREIKRIYSSSGVYDNFFDGPAGSFTS